MVSRFIGPMLVVPIAIGGVWLSVFITELKKRPLLPYRDPRFVAIVEEQGLARHG